MNGCYCVFFFSIDLEKFCLEIDLACYNICFDLITGVEVFGGEGVN